MRKEENDCRNCDTPTYPCRGDACSLRHALHVYCDICGEELDYDDIDLDSDIDICPECREKEEEAGSEVLE